MGTGVRTSQRRAADSGKESVRPKGGGVFERGTLNADRKGKPEGSRPIQRPYLMARVAKASSETRRVNPNATGKKENGT